MSAKSNFQFPKAPRLPNLRIPQTRRDFDELTYRERCQLLEEFPGTYEKFTSPDPW